MSIDRTILITGATGGIGEALATRLAADGARVLLGARSRDSGDRAADRIRTRVADAMPEVVTGDLSEMSQVRRLAEQVPEHTGRLDGLVLNAAEVRTTRRLTAEGLETNFATNYLAGFLLTALLTPLLRDSRPARIVTMSSSSHAHVKAVSVQRLAVGQDFRHTASYSATKLLAILHAAALAPLLVPDGATFNVADPGFVRTDLGRHARGGFAMFLKLAGIFQDTPENAAGTAYRLLTAPELADTTGGYFVGGRPKAPSPLARDARLAAEVREATSGLLLAKGLATRAELTP